MSTAPVSLPDVSDGLSRLATIRAALRDLDPDAQIALDPDGGRMKVLTVLPPEQVVEVMQALGQGGGAVRRGCRDRASRRKLWLRLQSRPALRRSCLPT
ncbi:hypothetical protein H1235_15495 [Pseudoxanthomonas sp. NC8]|nr:hypothetical protein H1235_15495 [Pseudoxanthomonas sp. NC8]